MHKGNARYRLRADNGHSFQSQGQSQHISCNRNFLRIVQLSFSFSWIDRREEQIQKAEAAEAKYSTELDKALDEYHELEARAEALDPDELKTARLALRPEEEKRAASKIEEAYGNDYDYATMREAR